VAVAMKPLRTAADRLLASTISILMAVMVINVLWQVFTRFVMGRPSSYTEEAARYMMIWVGLLGAAYATGQKSHLALDLLTARLRGARRRISEIIIQSAALLFALIMIGGGGRLVWIQLTLGQKSAALQIKTGYVYLAVPIAGVFIALYSVMALAEILRRPATDAALPEGRP
jgi:TRAP-type C4-dicarboxylate transport system permease small subunit